MMNIKSISYCLGLTAMLSLQACIQKEGPTVEERKAEQLQKYKDQLRDEKRTLLMTDSLIQLVVPRINEVTTTDFDYEKTEYDDLGRFRPKGMDPGDNVQKTYVRCAVDDYGRTQLIATYCGPKSFVVNQLRLLSSDGTGISTHVVEPNDGSNYSYDIDGTHYQTVTFVYAGHITEGMTQDSTLLANADTDGGALGFVAQQLEDKKLQCFLVSQSGKEQKVPLSEKDRMGMTATYELGILLRESVRLQQENKTASLKIQYLEELLHKKEIQDRGQNK